VRAYSTSSEEALLVRNLLKDWADEGFLTEAQSIAWNRKLAVTSAAPTFF